MKGDSLLDCSPEVTCKFVSVMEPTPCTNAACFTSRHAGYHTQECLIAPDPLKDSHILEGNFRIDRDSTVLSVFNALVYCVNSISLIYS